MEHAISGDSFFFGASCTSANRGFQKAKNEEKSVAKGRSPPSLPAIPQNAVLSLLLFPRIEIFKSPTGKELAKIHVVAHNGGAEVLMV